MPISTFLALAALISIIALLSLLFSLAAAKGIRFHSCGTGGEFSCSACPGQLSCADLGEKLSSPQGGGQ